MLLITIDDRIVLPNKLSRESIKHILTPLDIPEFIVQYSANMAASRDRFKNIGMDGYFSILNVVDLGFMSDQKIKSMRNHHFSLTLFPSDVFEGLDK